MGPEPSRAGRDAAARDRDDYPVTGETAERRSTEMTKRWGSVVLPIAAISMVTLLGVCAATKAWGRDTFKSKTYPLLQAPETYNLDGILQQMQKHNHGSD
jgi:hypothetical protein